MDLEQRDEGDAPFQEECNTGHFFSGGGRGAVLNDIKTALQGKVNLITLVGEEGSGKTMLCKMLQEQWQTHHKVLFLPKIVKSFEDVVRVAAQECELAYPAESSRDDAKKVFLDLVATLRDQGEALVLICDEAEKMYLATLERIRKILDDVNAEGGGLQVLLAGRKSLGANLEQLALCDFEEISEKQFFLSTLDDDETWGYLNFCVQGHRGDGKQEVFTKEAAAKIASMGKGNLRLINVHADESLRSSHVDTSFLVLFDHVKDDGSLAKVKTPARGLGVLAYVRTWPGYLLMGGGMLLLLLLVFGLAEKAPMVGSEKSKPADLVAPQVAPQVVAPQRMVEALSGEESREDPAKEDQVAPLQSPPTGEDDVVQPGVRKAVVAAKLAGEGSLEDLREKIEPSPLRVHLQEMELVEPSAPQDGVVDGMSPPIVGPSASVVPQAVLPVPETVPRQVAVPELATQSKITADRDKRFPGRRIVSHQKKKMVGRVGGEDYPLASPSGFEGDSVLGDLFREGAKWQGGARATSYSIQIMSLKSDGAAENLRRIVSQPEYQAVADKLVALKRATNPPVLMVFYGIYPSMAAARNARNNMPIFLRDRHPYPVSVRGAVEKSLLD